jgi:predicted nucleic acid-binding Zn ribbon protein
VDHLITSLGLAQRYYGWLMVSKWPEIVGEYYALKSRAFRFDEGTLYVAVEDSSWRQQMAMDTEKILNIIHNCPHGQVVKDLRLVMGDKRTHSDAN